MVNNKEMIQLWHKRLGHMPFPRIFDTLKSYLFITDSIVDLPYCDICPQAKQTRLPFSNRVSRSNSLFDLVHTDNWGPYKVPTIIGARYFLTIIEDYSRFTWTYLMVNKGDTHTYLIRFFNMINSQFGKTIKLLRSENMKQFLSSTMNGFLISQSTIQQISCVYTPQQNKIVERKHQHLLEVARALKFQASIPDRFWRDCLLTSTYIINRMPLVILQNKSHFEMLFDTTPDYSRIRIFGCLCYVTYVQPHKGKFDTRAHPCIFLGYPQGQKGYKTNNLITKSTQVSRDIQFKKRTFFHLCKVKRS